MFYYFLVLLAVIGLALQFSVTKYYQRLKGAALPVSLLYTGFSGIIAATLFFFINGCQIELTPFSALMAVCVSTLVSTYSLLSFKIMSLGNMSVYTQFLMLGGMMLPYFFGLIFLNEPLRVFPAIGLVLLSVSLLFPLFGKGNGNYPKLYYILCAIVFVVNGFVSITSKIHQYDWGFETADAQGFLILTNSWQAIISFAVFFIVRAKNRGVEKPAPEIAASLKSKKKFLPVLLIFANASIGGVSYMLQLISASNLPATVLYPMITGGLVVLMAVSGRVFFKERLSKSEFIGICLSFAATFLFLF